MKKSILTAADLTIGKVTLKKKNSWFDKECEEIVQTRQVYKDFLNRPTRRKRRNG